MLKLFAGVEIRGHPWSRRPQAAPPCAPVVRGHRPAGQSRAAGGEDGRPVRRVRRPTRDTNDGQVRGRLHQAFTAEIGRQPRYEEYAQIMTGYTPKQVPVISSLARGIGM